MPLYTARVRLATSNMIARGASYVEHSWHFLADDDATALTAAEPVSSAYANGAIAQRLVVPREINAHEVAIYRRSTEIRSSWTLLGALAFSIGDLFTFDWEFELSGVPLQLSFRQAFIDASTRRAVVCIQRGATPSLTRRVYLGPLSPVAAVATGNIQVPVLGDELLHIWARDTPLFAPALVRDYTGDAPYDPASVDNQLVPEGLQEIAGDHAANLFASAEGCTPVVVSWQHSTIEPVARVQTSQVWSSIGSRSSRMPLRERSD